ncbi:hypothetical protein B0H63DRAFT_506286, partial [Podospora didyma]
MASTFTFEALAKSTCRCRKPKLGNYLQGPSSHADFDKDKTDYWKTWMWGVKVPVTRELDPKYEWDPYLTGMLLVEEGGFLEPHEPAAWFSDVSYGFLPVTSGYRRVLTFDMIEYGKSISSGRLLEDQHSDLRNVWSGWVGDPGRHGYLCHALSHNYRHDLLYYSLFGKADRTLIEELLEEICPSLGLEVFLAKLERKVVGACGEARERRNHAEYTIENRGRRQSQGLARPLTKIEAGIEEHFQTKLDHGLREYYAIETVLEEEFSFKVLLDDNVNDLAASLDLLTDNVLDQSCFNNLPPQEEKAGDGGVGKVSTVTHWYTVLAIVLVPSSSVLSFLGEITRPALGYLLHRSLYSFANDNHFRHIKLALTPDVIRKWPDKIMSRERIVSDALAASLRFRDQSMFEELVTHATDITAYEICEPLWQWVVLRPSFLGDIAGGISTLLKKFARIHDRYEILSIVVASSRESNLADSFLEPEIKCLMVDGMVPPPPPPP